MWWSNEQKKKHRRGERKRCEESIEKRGFGEKEVSTARRRLDLTGTNTTWHVYPFLMT